MSLRHEFMNEFGARFTWLVKNSRHSVLIGIIKLINAVWFAGLWQAGLALNRPLIIWLVFMVVSMTAAVWLDGQSGLYKQSETDREHNNG